MKKKRIVAVVLTCILTFTNMQIISFAEEDNIESQVIDVVPDDEGYIENELDNDAPVVFYNNAAVQERSYNSDIAALRSAYPAVGDQNPYGTCWAFSVASLAMIDMMIDNRVENNSVDYSELQLAYFLYNSPSNDPLNGTGEDITTYSDNETSYLDRGGNYTFSIRRLAQWAGFTTESVVPYTSAGSLSSLGDEYAYNYNKARLENAYRISISENSNDVKAMIKKHGAVGISYLHNNTALAYSSSANAYTYYDNAVSGYGHMVVIVGWDDDFAVENFSSNANRPTSNGAWLCRNSWGNYCDYFWMSYETASINDAAWVLDFTTADNYDNNYQYDGALNIYHVGYTKAANVFTVRTDDGKGETLKAVSVSMTNESQVNYKIEVYRGLTGDNPTSGTLVSQATTQGIATYAGYHTIPLISSVELNEGEKFSIVVTVDKSGALDHEYNQSVRYVDSADNELYMFGSGSKKGQSFSYIDGQFYDDYYIGGNYCIKAFTDNNTNAAVQEKEKCIVTYDANGGSCIVTTKEYFVGDAYANLPTPLRAGYDFDGWWTTKDAGGRRVATTDIVTKNTIIYARWKNKQVSTTYRTHVQNEGWQGYVSNGEMSGTSGKALRLEGININVSGNANLGVCYSTHIENIGWQTPVVNGEMSGTTGQALRLEAIMIGLTGSEASSYDIYYRVHAQNFGWMGWTKNGAPAGTAGYAYRLEGIQIAVVKAGTSLSEVQNKYGHGIVSNVLESYISTTYKTPALNKKTAVQYRTHVENIGWQPFYNDGAMAGTSGQALRLEGIEIELKNKEYSGGISYRTHVENIGWQSYVSDGAMAGTSGRALRLEAICIGLTGDMANHYDIYYRVHAQNFGWMGWTKNGAPAGTAGYAYRLEGIQIVLVPKNSSPPSGVFDGIFQNTAVSYKSK